MLFDLDGTLHDWEAAVRRAVDATVPHLPARHQGDLPARFQAVLADAVRAPGRGAEPQHWRVLVDPAPLWRAALADADDATVSDAAQRFRAALDAAPFPDAAPALARLQPRYTLGVLSNMPAAERLIHRLGLRSYFAAVISAPDDRRKPHPDAYALALAALGVAAAEAAYVGDSLPNDVRGALAAGLTAVWLDRPGHDRPLPAGAQRVRSLADLPDLLGRLRTAPAAG